MMKMILVAIIASVISCKSTEEQSDTKALYSKKDSKDRYVYPFSVSEPNAAKIFYCFYQAVVPQAKKKNTDALQRLRQAKLVAKKAVESEKLFKYLTSQRGMFEWNKTARDLLANAVKTDDFLAGVTLFSLKSDEESRKIEAAEHLIQAETNGQQDSGHEKNVKRIRPIAVRTYATNNKKSPDIVLQELVDAVVALQKSHQNATDCAQEHPLVEYIGYK